MKSAYLLILLGIVGILPLGCGSPASTTPTAPSSSGPNYTYPFVSSFGQTGSGSNGTFNHPAGILAAFGAIYVTDEYYSAINKFDLHGNYLGQNYYGSAGDLDGMDMDKNRHLYVANFDNSSVDEFDQNLNFITSFTAGGGFNGPNDVKVDNNLNLFVLDYTDGAVYEVDQTDTLIGVSSGIPSGMSTPYQMARTPNGNFYVGDSGNNRVVALDSSLVYTGSFDGSSSGTALTDPEGMASDSDGNLIVADYTQARVLKFTPSGAFLKSIGNTAASVTWVHPYFVATDSSKRVYVSDFSADTVSVFNPY